LMLNLIQGKRGVGCLQLKGEKKRGSSASTAFP
jgi:hypothetical protein